MTVIAWDGRVLAADGRMSGDTILYDDKVNKIYETKIKGLGTCIVALAGACLLIGPYLEHLQQNGLTKFDASNYSSDPKAGLGGLIVTTKGTVIEFESEGGWYEVSGPTAIGSGGIIAHHYLTKGEDALTAVTETCKTELTCGGRITTYDSKSKVFMEYDPE